MNLKKRYNDFNGYLRNIFDCRVQKISVDAGFSCPNRDGKIAREGCIFCNEKGSGTGLFKKGVSVKEQILNGKKAMIRRYKAKKFFPYLQSFSNTYAPLEKLKSVYDDIAQIDDVVGFSVGTRPDCVDDEILDLLASYTKHHLVWVEYGLQSSNDKTLKYINRGHDFKCFADAVAQSQKRKIKVCAHIILGLPLEDKKDMINTAKSLADIGIDGIKIHLLYIVRGTKMGKMYLKGQYKCLSQEEYVEIAADILEILPSSVVIQRLAVDPHPDELVAPLWCHEKSKILNEITKKLEKRGTMQGSLYLLKK